MGWMGSMLFVWQTLIALALAFGAEPFEHPVAVANFEFGNIQICVLC